MKNKLNFFYNFALNCRYSTEQQSFNSINSINQKIDPNFVTGFSDGESCFRIILAKNSKYKIGYNIRVAFQIIQKQSSNKVLYKIQEYFEVGNIYNKKSPIDMSSFEINKIQDIINKVILHFDKYPLLTSKHLNYLLWKEAVYLIHNKKLNKESFTLEDLNKIKNLIEQMNTNLTFENKFEFCKENSINKIIHPQWFSGFSEAESCFYFKISSGSIGASFELVQNTHDYFLLKLIRDWLGHGHIYPKLNEITIEEAQKAKSVSKLYINNKEGIIKIISHFNNYPLYTKKSDDFEDWKTLISMKDKKLHLNKDSLDLMIKIKSGMNKFRK